MGLRSLFRSITIFGIWNKKQTVYGKNYSGIEAVIHEKLSFYFWFKKADIAMEARQ
jgi:hypothetical protein